MYVQTCLVKDQFDAIWILHCNCRKICISSEINSRWNHVWLYCSSGTEETTWNGAENNLVEHSREFWKWRVYTKQGLETWSSWMDQQDEWCKGIQNVGKRCIYFSCMILCWCDTRKTIIMAMINHEVSLLRTKILQTALTDDVRIMTHRAFWPCGKMMGVQGTFETSMIVDVP